jgi:hypothetical protein
VVGAIVASEAVVASGAMVAASVAGGAWVGVAAGPQAAASIATIIRPPRTCHFMVLLIFSSSCSTVSWIVSCFFSTIFGATAASFPSALYTG